MSLKKFFKKIRYGERCDSQTYIKYLKKKGVTIGDRTVIFDPQTTIIDETRPWMIEIGNDVQITSGVTLLTHGYDWSVLKGVYGEVLGSSGVLKIGNNVFIGMHSTILKGVTIGNNVIIGANSLVNKDIPDNCVAAGNPCRVIMSLEEYYKKRKNVQIDEATELVRAYREKKGIDPDEYALHEFFWLFSDNPDDIPPIWTKMNELVGNEKLTKQKMVEHKKIFDNMKQFLKSIV
ncbi:acyltransferase [Streptococcus thermophilus]|uniref:acyltransferase n=1 Tax=Streptococcus thermophilus TaxID=1308 RepID=UPI0022FE3C6D|nr:acyltransferase [Streptococcus thermophilus]MDA5538608.1 acyltransferase [Streptococcus thermophilus]MDA5553050.1 acyltransferase [Streptococcus thermophilus]WCL59793.1 acyltransferase [Streptococcus thermophilus]